MRGKPQRISISKIGKQIGRLSLLEKHIDKVPLAKDYSENHIESIDAFHKRRIKWAIVEIESQGEEVTEWRVMRKAGIDVKTNKVRQKRS